MVEIAMLVFQTELLLFLCLLGTTDMLKKQIRPSKQSEQIENSRRACQRDIERGLWIGVFLWGLTWIGFINSTESLEQVNLTIQIQKVLK